MNAFLLSTFMLIGLSSLSALAEFREWTSSDGRTLLAEFVQFQDDQVTIKRRVDGREFSLPLTTLSETDQAWVREQGAALQKQAELEAAKADASNPFARLVTGNWERHEGDGLKYRFYGDPKLRDESSGDSPKTYPLVIYLHGKNGDVMTPEKPWDPDNFAKTESFRERPCFILVPQAPKDNETWQGKNGEAVVEIAEDLIKHLPIDEKRIYLTGYSMGAFGTFHLLASEPKFFAAAVPIAGGGDPSGVRRHRKVPVWVFHGAKDDVVDLEQSQRMVDAMEKARAPVKFEIFPEGDHGISGKVYGRQDVHEWLFQQVRP